MMITIPGKAITKKNSQRILYRNGRAFIAPSAAYERYEREAGYHLTPRPRKPLTGPLEVKCLYYMPTHHRVDLTNLLEATDDILVRYRIIEDDHSGVIVSHDGSRVLYDKAHPRTEIYISRLEDRNG
jgi:Holliday junction resolvase RusA-like endonuclease